MYYGYIVILRELRCQVSLLFLAQCKLLQHAPIPTKRQISQPTCPRSFPVSPVAPRACPSFPRAFCLLPSPWCLRHPPCRSACCLPWRWPFRALSMRARSRRPRGVGHSTTQVRGAVSVLLEKEGRGGGSALGARGRGCRACATRSRARAAPNARAGQLRSDRRAAKGAA